MLSAPDMLCHIAPTILCDDPYVADTGNNRTGIDFDRGGRSCSVSPIRTTNAGQGFQGFWRPTTDSLGTVAASTSTAEPVHRRG